MFLRIRNSLILNKGLMYVNTTLKGETEGVLAFVIPVAQCCMVLNGVYRDASHQGQQQTLALAQERFWWPMMAEDCYGIVRRCLHCQAFEGEVPRAPLCLIRAYAPLELVHLDYTSIESMMELNKPPMVKNVLVMTDHFMRYALAVVTKDQTAKTVAKVFYERFIAIFGAPAKLLSDRGVNFMSALVEELCSVFGIQKCRTHGLPCTVQRAGGAFPSDTISHDWQVIAQQEGSMGATHTRSPAGLQQHPVGGDRLLATLSDVWEASMPPC